MLDAGKLVMPLRQEIKSPMKYCLLYPKELSQWRELQMVIRWLHAQAAGTRK